MERDTKKTTSSRPLSAGLRSGAVAFAFLIIGYEAALFVHRAAQLRVEAATAVPDTVYVADAETAESILGRAHATSAAPSSRSASSSKGPGGISKTLAGNSKVQGGMQRTAEQEKKVVIKKVQRNVGESFHFNPNTVSGEDLQRLGFTQKQAQSILNYRDKGGHFNRKEDFAASFVVSEEMFSRLEAFIDIPLLDINLADSAAFDALPGIGGYYAAKMVEEREKLGGYSCTEQLMEIWNFTRERYDGLSDLVYVGTPAVFPLWTADETTLSQHPYIRSRAIAHSIVLFRDNNPRSLWTPDALLSEGVIDSLTCHRLSLLQP